ncbi:MAG TPA: hypothetical protein VGO11_22010 [Chthoniobacteraceae bacterium]|jgi:hypothetical protein|nr:hypothetical protein [Chthoniobacteraceae bacterium]
MKTITEYQPLIFGELFGQAQKRLVRRRSAWKAAVLILPIVYVGLGLKITVDTGLRVWDPRFWLIFVPLFLLGERLLWALSLETKRDGDGVRESP